MELCPAPKGSYSLSARFVKGVRRVLTCGDGGGAVPGPEGIVLALRSLCEGGEAVGHAQRLHVRPPARQNLVGVRLVTHVPDDLVLGQVEHLVQRHRQLNHAQAEVNHTTHSTPVTRQHREEAGCAQQSILEESTLCLCESNSVGNGSQPSHASYDHQILVVQLRNETRRLVADGWGVNSANKGRRDCSFQCAVLRQLTRT
eukprot:3614032-Pyramimonas_sp.AAC.1